MSEPLFHPAMMKLTVEFRTSRVQETISKLSQEKINNKVKMYLDLMFLFYNIANKYVKIIKNPLLQGGGHKSSSPSEDAQ